MDIFQIHNNHITSVEIKDIIIFIHYILVCGASLPNRAEIFEKKLRGVWGTTFVFGLGGQRVKSKWTDRECPVLDYEGSFKIARGYMIDNQDV